MSFRKEEKLNINKNQLFNLLEWVVKNGGHKIYDDRIVSSTYFDNDNLQMFKDSEEGIVPRKKVRIRSYYKGKHEIDSSTFEIKRSSVEGRFKTSTKKFNLKKALKFGYFDPEYGVLQPKARVSYKRSYYKVLNVRLTIDRDIEYVKINNQNKETYKTDEKDIIVEVKADSEISVEYLYRNFSFDRIRFSKYSKAINSF